MRTKVVVASFVFAVVALVSGCASSTEGASTTVSTTIPDAVPSSELPRVTDAEITITVVEMDRTLPVEGCGAYWQGRDEEPPPGACEVTKAVQEFTAEHSTGTVKASVILPIHINPEYAMQRITSSLDDGVFVIVVRPPAHTDVVRLIDSTGATVDEVKRSDRLVALAGLGPSLTVEALSPDGLVIAECPPDTQCTRNEDIPESVTTIP